MFIGLSKTIGKVGGFRLGVGMRLTAANFWWLLIVIFIVAMFKLMFYMLVFSLWLMYAMFYGVYWIIKQIVKGIIHLIKGITGSRKKNMS